MTETLVRDTTVDGIWHVFIDGFEIGSLWAQEQEDGSTVYGYSYQDYISTTVYVWLSDAERTLVQLFKTDLMSSQFTGALTS